MPSLAFLWELYPSAEGERRATGFVSQNGLTAAQDRDRRSRPARLYRLRIKKRALELLSNTKAEQGRFEEIDHTADRAFRISGADLASLFLSAAKALCCAGVTSGGQDVQRVFIVEGIVLESLLVNWLNELLCLQELHGEAYHDIRIEELSERRIRAYVHGSKQTSSNRVIKAVTFHNLEVRRKPDGWEATLVIDV